MSDVVRAMLVLIALEHFGFFALEALLWTKPIGLKVFRMTPEVAAASRTLAMNQGLYNGFLAAGLLWGAAGSRGDVATFFAACVAVAGVFGAATASRRIFFVQALPALLALALLTWSSGGL